MAKVRCRDSTAGMNEPETTSSKSTQRDPLVGAGSDVRGRADEEAGEGGAEEKADDMGNVW